MDLALTMRQQHNVRELEASDIGLRSVATKFLPAANHAGIFGTDFFFDTATFR